MARSVSPAVAAMVRPATNQLMDAAAVRAIAQAAVEVELFTIPLYMATLYSIQGTHQITGANDYYQNRLWPGSAPAVDESAENQLAFNLIFSVFIEEMLHLQLAANMATAIGATPCFSENALQDSQHGWTCYGDPTHSPPTVVTTIPRIVDLRDTTHPGLEVQLGELSAEQVELFLFIEQDEAAARADITDPGKYFPTVPFAGWTPSSTDADLPMFGTIGHMYQCYLDYLALTYDDGTQLVNHVYTPASVQRDMFNALTPPQAGHQPEYPGFQTTFVDGLSATPLQQLMAMMDAITDQGEGHLLRPPDLLGVVQDRYRASRPNLETDYPQYSDAGEPLPPAASAIASARCNHDGNDHYERFLQLQGLVGSVTTWSTWLQGHQWTAADLESGPPADTYAIPTTAQVATALQTATTTASLYTTLSLAATGSLYGITSVLDHFWQDATVGFPFPSMVGSGDRMSICFALFGRPPSLATMELPRPNTLYHACQALDLDQVGDDCAAPAVYHACRGSNGCKAQGGCGFVQSTAGGGSCGGSSCSGMTLAAKDTTGRPNGCGGPTPPVAPTTFSAPGDNRCAGNGKGFGGCAVPISASQLLARNGAMELYDFPGPDQPSVPIGTLTFEAGQNVHDVAYRAYLEVMAHRGEPAPPTTPPAPNLVRLVFPPST